MKITVVIPALNEEKAIGAVLDQIPVAALAVRGYEVEKLVVDNGSSDRGVAVAEEYGAVVVHEPKRGYGHAYQKGFAHATGDIVVTGDADMTYPFDDIPRLVDLFEKNNIDFMTTNRFSTLKKGVMPLRNWLGNQVLSVVAQILFRWPFKDSQSGMWMFKRSLWPTLEAQSGGMSFSEEIKLEAFSKGYTCMEVSIPYRMRVGEAKLRMFRDGLHNLLYLCGRYMKTFKKGEVPLFRTSVASSPGTSGTITDNTT